MEENKEEIHEEQRKKSPSLIIIVISAILLICAAIGVIVGTKLSEPVNNKKENQEQNQSETQGLEDQNIVREEISIEDFIVQKLFNTFSLNNGQYMININNDNRVKLRIAYENMERNKFSSIACSKVGAFTESGKYGGICNGGASSEEYHQALIEYNKQKMKEIIEQGAFTESISSSEMKRKIEELFGSEYQYKPEDFEKGWTCDISPSGNFMHYDEANDVFANYTTPTGGTCAGFAEELVKAYTEENKLYLEGTVTQIPSGTVGKTVYEFKKDAKNGNYVFVQLTTE